MERGGKLVTNGTDNHMMVLDTMKTFDKSGKDIQEKLEAAGITLNKNAIPDDTLPPFQASGVRLGTPSATSRGMGESEMGRIAGWMMDICRETADVADVRKEVRQLCLAFPSPSGLVQDTST